MKNEPHKIIIIPARFLEKQDDRYVIRCLIQLDGNITQDRIFEEYSLREIENPKYLFIGIMTGIGYKQINYTDANEFEELFIKKWKILTK